METYDGPLPANVSLIEASAAINDKVNLALKAARDKTAGKSPAMAAEVYALLGKPTFPKVHLAPIEDWASRLLKAEANRPGMIYEPRVEDSQYRGTTVGIGTREFAPVMQVGQTLFGVDKLGHFFQLGYKEYYARTLSPDSLSTDDAGKEGDKSEVGTYGLGFTAVYSRADIAANRAGLKFYQALDAAPGVAFSIRSYLTDQWNEQSNTNLYTKALTKQMFTNNLPGQWQGSMSWADGSTAVAITFPATFDISGVQTMDELRRSIQHFTGKYQYRHPLASFTSGVLEGTLSSAVNSDGAVIASEIDLTWTEGGASGKGKLKVESLKSMSGTWGRGGSATDGGAWRFTKSS